MNLFWLLLLAHLVGDFALQTDRVFYYKTKKSWGLWVHVGICSACNVLLTIPYLRYPLYWIILIVLTLSHYIYDHSKIKLTENGVDDNSPIFIIDQILHFSTAFVAALAFYYVYPGTEEAGWGVWSNMVHVQLLSGFVLIIFAIAPLNYFLINDYYAYLKKLNRPHWNFPDSGQRRWGYIERGLIAFAIIYNGWWLLLIPVALPLRFLFDKKYHYGDFFLSIALSVVLAIGLNRLLPHF